MGNQTRPKLAGLQHDLWDQEQQVSAEENDMLTLTFLPKEIDDAVAAMKTDTAPGRR